MWKTAACVLARHASPVLNCSAGDVDVRANEIENLEVGEGELISFNRESLDDQAGFCKTSMQRTINTKKLLEIEKEIVREVALGE